MMTHPALDCKVSVMADIACQAIGFVNQHVRIVKKETCIAAQTLAIFNKESIQG